MVTSYDESTRSQPLQQKTIIHFVTAVSHSLCNARAHRTKTLKTPMFTRYLGDHTHIDDTQATGWSEGNPREANLGSALWT